MGAADCITAVISNAQQYNMHIKTQLHKYIYIPIYKQIINKREPKANIPPPPPPLGMSIALYALNMKPKWQGHLLIAPLVPKWLPKVDSHAT